VKTVPTAVTAKKLITTIEPASRADAEALVRMFETATGEPPVMWGSSIIGFGSYRYTYDSGREGDMCIAGVSPRRSAFVLKRLQDVDTKVLATLVRTSSAHVRATQRCEKCVTSRAKAKASSRSAS
jgi:hypothetical protein